MRYGAVASAAVKRLALYNSLLIKLLRCIKRKH
jgi:hypothetical protein